MEILVTPMFNACSLWLGYFRRSTRKFPTFMEEKIHSLQESELQVVH